MSKYLDDSYSVDAFIKKYSYNLDLFEIGQTVYLKTDIEQRARLITAILFRAGGSITYCLACDIGESWHYGLEISDEQNIMMITNN